MNRRRLGIGLGSCALAGVALFGGHALAGDGDHNLARRALQGGEVRPLHEILATLRSELAGDVIEVKFRAKRRGKPHMYEFTVLTPDGRVVDVKVDAATARVVKLEND